MDAETKQGPKAPLARPSVIAVLEAARELLARGWTRGWYARDATGNMRNPWDPSVTCWCSIGAVYAGAGSWARVGSTEIAEALRLVSGDRWACDLANWNDKTARTQAQVLARFDRTIADQRGTATEWSP